MTSIDNGAIRGRRRRIFSYLGMALALVVPSLVAAQIATELGAAESFATGETLTADKLNRLVTSLRNAGPGLGSVIAHMPNVPGAMSISDMNKRGWAVCDGSSTSEVTGAVIATTPDLQGQFLRGIGGTYGPANSGDKQVGATAKNGLSFPHQHADRVTDNQGGACNVPLASFPGQSTVRLQGPQALWDYNAGASTATSATGCNYLTGPAVNASSASTDIGQGDPETRPANVGVVWMMRVR